jgi:hypothetical protein
LHGVGTASPYFALSLVFLLPKIFAAARFGGSEQGTPLARPAPARTSSHELDWFFPLSTGSQIPFFKAQVRCEIFSPALVSLLA